MPVSPPPPPSSLAAGDDNMVKKSPAGRGIAFRQRPRTPPTIAAGDNARKHTAAAADQGRRGDEAGNARQAAKPAMFKFNFVEEAEVPSIPIFECMPCDMCACHVTCVHAM